MTAERRLAKIEANLSPTERIVRWLDEAHAHVDIATYVRSLLAEEGFQVPGDRLAQDAVNGAHAALRGKPRDTVTAAVNLALRETVFRYELVLRITEVSHELLDREALIQAALAPQLGLLDGADAEERAEPAYLRRFARVRDMASERVLELHASEAARAIVEDRYLAGHPALFPAAAEAWAEQVTRTERLADVAVSLATDAGVPAAEPEDPEAVATRAELLVADLVEPARATALEKLGEHRRAVGLASEWVRTNLLIVVQAQEVE